MIKSSLQYPSAKPPNHIETCFAQCSYAIDPLFRPGCVRPTVWVTPRSLEGSQSYLEPAMKVSVSSGDQIYLAALVSWSCDLSLTRKNTFREILHEFPLELTYCRQSAVLSVLIMTKIMTAMITKAKRTR